MLPFEICTLIIMASGARAIPQSQILSAANSTVIQSGSASWRTDKGVHQESTATGFELDEPTRTPKVVALSLTEAPLVIIEETATGFDSPSITTPLQFIPEQTPEVITTNTPTVISIHTEIATTVIGYPTNEVKPGSEASPQPSSDGNLLNNIISRIGNPLPGAQPSSQHASTTGGNALYEISKSAPLGDGNTGHTVPTAPAVMESPGAQPTLSVDGTITLGSAILTLSNGLSTAVDTGPAATFVAITTNSAGYTVIVVSSSGTAVTATMSNAPITITLPKTGWDASITAAARIGNNPGPIMPTTTSSKGAAERRTWDTWIGIAVGILGSGAIL